MTMTTNESTTEPETVDSLPSFGIIQIEEPEPDAFVGCLGHNDLDDLSAADLRQSAHDATEAGNWLEEAQR